MFEKKKKQLKVLHLPGNAGGNAWGLSRGERENGLESYCLITEPQGFLDYSSDINLNLHKTKTLKERFKALVKAFFAIRNKYDIFHFNFGASLFGYPTTTVYKYKLLDYIDLKFYPKKAKLFVTYNGCDARQKSKKILQTKISPCHDSNCYNGICDTTPNIEYYKARGIEIMSRHVKHMWALNPDLLYFLPKYKSSLLPYTIHNYHKEIFFPKFDKKLNIIHAPTNRACKGSHFILDALERLKEKYPNEFNLIIIEGKSHEEALKLYQTADLVIDQILIGWYGAFAVELMLMGKPVIVRIAKEDLKFLPKQMRNDLENTIINADPTNIYEVLEKCINDRVFLKQRAQASIEYANKWHDPKYVASLTKEKYEE